MVLDKTPLLVGKLGKLEAVMQQLHPSSQPLTLQLSIFNEQHGNTTVIHVSSFPLQIGRGTQNDLILDHAFVSQKHAAIGFIEGRLHVLQLGKSNKLQVDGRPLATGEAALLGAREVIHIRPFRLTFRVVAQQAGALKDSMADEAVRRGAARSEIAPTTPERGPSTVVDKGAPVLTPPSTVASPPAVVAPAGAVAPTVPIASPVAALPPQVERILQLLLENFVALEQGRYAFRDSIKLPAQEPAFGIRLDVPAVEQARSLLGGLLGGGEAALERLRSALATHRGHQVGLIDGMMAGVRAMLGRLSPSAIEGQAAAEHHLVSAKLLWRLFERAHGDLAEGGHHLFKAIFGSHFKAAYAKLADADHGQGTG